MSWCSPERDTDPKGLTVPGKGRSLPQPWVGTKFAAHMTDTEHTFRFRNNAAFCSMKASSQSQNSCSVHVITRAHPEAGSSSVWLLCLCHVVPVCQCEGVEFPSRGEGVIKFQLPTKPVRMEWETTGLPVASNSPGDSLLDLNGFKWPSGMRILDRLGR